MWLIMKMFKTKYKLPGGLFIANAYIKICSMILLSCFLYLAKFSTLLAEKKTLIKIKTFAKYRLNMSSTTFMVIKIVIYYLKLFIY